MASQNEDQKDIDAKMNLQEDGEKQNEKEENDILEADYEAFLNEVEEDENMNDDSSQSEKDAKKMKELPKPAMDAIIESDGEEEPPVENKIPDVPAVNPKQITLNTQKHGTGVIQRKGSLTQLGIPRNHSAHRLFRRGSSTGKGSMPELQHSTSYGNFDHTPHSLFVELDEIHVLNKGSIPDWKKKARWIKFEENMEELAGRWGNPHVASLDFHSLLDLRKCLEQGVVLLDCEHSSLSDIMNEVTDELIKIDMLQAQYKKTVMNIIQHKQSVNKHGKKSSTHSIASHDGYAYKDVEESHGVKINIKTENENGFTNSAYDDTIEMVNEGNHTYNRHLSFPFRHEPAILKHIPVASETAAVLVGTVEFLEKPIAALVRLSEPQHISNLTQVPLPVRFMFILLGSSDTCLNYYETGRAIGTLMANGHFHDVAYAAEERKDVLKALSWFLNESMVLPPGKVDEDVLLPLINIIKNREEEHQKKEQEILQIEFEEEIEQQVEEFDPLARTKKPFGGVWNNMKERYPLYWSDIKDALHPQCLGTFFYIYFACLAPAITFGGLMGTKTEHWLGVSEMLVGTSIIGGVFSLVAGQPLLILGGTGPTLVFEESLFQISNSLDVDFLAFRFWVGFWVAIIAFVSMGAEAVALMKYVSRFTKDVFAVLISLIFIIETFLKIDDQFKKHPLVADYAITEKDETEIISINDNLTTSDITTEMYNDTSDINITSTPVKLPQPNTALLSFILTMCTFALAYALKQFQRSQYLGKRARKLIGDFSVPIAMAVMVVIDVALKETYTEKLDVPDGVVPARSSDRGWIINPKGQEKPFPVWTMFVAVIPAFVLYILLYLEILISSMIVNKKEQKLRKGTGYHLDMLYVSASAIVSGLIGTPFLSVATVRSVGHVRSLEVYGGSVAPGEKPNLEFVREQRVTNFLAHILLGVSTLLGVVLRYIPISVLFGVFLFMGVSSLVGLQLYDRIHLIFMPVKHHPDVPYVKNVRTWKMHLFTFIQLVCLGLLWGVKSTRAALAFPFILILMVPFRIFVLKYFFTPKELCYLNSEDSDIKTADNVNSKNSNKDNENEDKAKTNVHVAKSKANAQV